MPQPVAHHWVTDLVRISFAQHIGRTISMKSPPAAICTATRTSRNQSILKSPNAIANRKSAVEAPFMWIWAASRFQVSAAKGGARRAQKRSTICNRHLTSAAFFRFKCRHKVMRHITLTANEIELWTQRHKEGALTGFTGLTCRRGEG